MLGFCIVFLVVVLSMRYGYIQVKSGKNAQPSNDFTPINVGESNRAQKRSLEDALQN